MLIEFNINFEGKMRAAMTM